MWTNNTTPLSTRIREPDTNASCHGPFKRSNSLRPNYRVCRTGTRNCNYQGEISHHWIVDCDKNDVADNYRGFDLSSVSFDSGVERACTYSRQQLPKVGLSPLRSSILWYLGTGSTRHMEAAANLSAPWNIQLLPLNLQYSLIETLLSW